MKRYVRAAKTFEDYKNSGKFDEDQLKVIKEGLKQGVDVSVYANPRLSDMVMRAMKNDMHDYHLGKEDVKLYANPRFDWYQIIVLRDGLHHGVDIRPVAKPSVDLHEMKEFIENAIRERDDSYSVDEEDYDDDDHES